MANVASAGRSIDEPHREAAGYVRPACNECQRRKQKCNRQWPCDRCLRRKIAHECRYNYPALTQVPSRDVADKPERTHDDNDADEDGSDGQVEHQEGSGFDSLAVRFYTALGVELGVTEQPAPTQDYARLDDSSCPQIQRVLKLLPQRDSMDALVHIFLNDINYHYYIIYPPVFLQDYHIWWDRVHKKSPLSLQYTCLLAATCAIVLQHADPSTANTLLDGVDRELLGDTLEAAADRLHAAARALASVIPIGHHHHLNVQRLLHSCYWYQTEARFPLAWHALSAAILEARELGYHQEPAAGSVTEVDLEMRRRLWCILDTWDWQISSRLSRPKIIDHSDCNTELPKLTLEGHAVSPLLHMKMQSGLTRQLVARFGGPMNITAPSEVQEHRAIIEEWVHKFPPEYSPDHPDRGKDGNCPWLFSHRLHTYTTACLLILNPMRPYMVKQSAKDSPADEVGIREVGTWYSLRLIKTLRLWVNKMDDNRDGRRQLRFIIFSVLDTAAVLCAEILKDTDRTIRDRPAVLGAIGDAVHMLTELGEISATSKTCYDILERLVRRLPEAELLLDDNDNDNDNGNDNGNGNDNDNGDDDDNGNGNDNDSEMERQAKRPKVERSLPQSQRPPPAATSTPGIPRAATPLRVHASAVHRPQAMTVPAVTTTVQHPQAIRMPAVTPTVQHPQAIRMPGVTTATATATRSTNAQAPAPAPVAAPMPTPPWSGPMADPTTTTATTATTPVNYGLQQFNHSSAQFTHHQYPTPWAPSHSPPQYAYQQAYPSSSYMVAPNNDNACVSNGPYQPQSTDAGPEFHNKNLTDAQLGELAPQWNWHSGNLDPANPPWPVAGPQQQHITTLWKRVD
ncbi:hypothetical protein QQS21_012833 [Conoideocrella luteorostrata]|uniref:Zn(2)-C6 fungal-type domain-containing protein n=1 Tax=Conoideocrella luteorostrata TaxID=1105319 RepID=A0AAJ0CD62_9HYPO|nr:hypothetical protein QQS21_012833 [Conoideocrella luteorostrata]